MSHHKYRVLLVEDDPLTLRLAQMELRCFDELVVDTATDGKQALSLAFNNSYDLILMDVYIPEMDGLDVTKLLRAAGSWVPIVGITARDCRQECLAAGMNDCLRKPVDYLRVADCWLSKMEAAS